MRNDVAALDLETLEVDIGVQKVAKDQRGIWSALAESTLR